MKKECMNCGKEFEEEKWRERKYCSLECACQARRGNKNAAWKGGKVTRRCLQCGQEFQTWLLTLSRGHGTFCSRSCAAKARTGEKNPNWKGGKQSRACEMCGKEFEVFPYIGNNPKQGRFCSRDCANRWISESRDPDRGGKISIVCKVCGKEFETYLSRANTRKLCSKECAHKLKAQQMRGPGNHSWEGGKTEKCYPAEFNERFKRLIRERDGFKCALCKSSGNHVHHIDYEKSNSTPENCITLCASCHGKVHSKENRDQTINVLRDILRNRLASTAGK